MNLRYFDYPMHKILRYVFKTGRVIYTDDVIFDQIQRSKFFVNITDLERDFAKLQNGEGYIVYSGWDIKPIIIRFIYNDYKLQRVEYSIAGKDIIKILKR